MLVNSLPISVCVAAGKVNSPASTVEQVTVTASVFMKLVADILMMFPALLPAFQLKAVVGVIGSSAFGAVTVRVWTGDF